MNRKLEKFFKAEAVVLIGFSPSPKNLCRNIIANLRRWGYQGRIYGISPYEGENDGVRIYTSLEQLPEKPEVGLIFTRAELVPELLLDCARNQIRHIVISSAGFEETGTEKGLELAGQIKAIAEEKGLYIIGPNCIGTSNTQNGLCLSFMPLDPLYASGPASGRENSLFNSERRGGNFNGNFNEGRTFSSGQICQCGK